MINRQIKLSLVASMLLTSTLIAIDDFANATITSTPFETTELEATSSIEIYTQEDIKKSNSSDIYEFLNEQNSVITMPASGNIFTQKLDLRGYGITNGYENIVVIVDGQRLNNIDMTPQILSTIPIEIIESIEIHKGSGSVQYGDGATAGVINIKTNGKYNNKLNISIGNNNTTNASLILGYNNDNIIINALFDEYSGDGNRKITADGLKDERSKSINKLDLKYFLNDYLEIRASINKTKFHNTYANGMTLAKYEQDPTQLGTISGGKYYSENKTDSTTKTFGTTYTINNKNILDLYYITEYKISNFITPWVYKNDYDMNQLNSKYKYKTNTFKLIFGANKIDAKRIGSTNTTTKNNFGTFISTEFKPNNNHQLLMGVRTTKVTYNYKNSTNDLTDKEKLKAFNFGYNYKINSQQSIFINYNKAFQAPNIDRFFSGATFNGFIKPAKSKTLNIGYNNFTETNKLKATIFRSNIKDEIYYYDTVGFANDKNTNLDRTHKYGLEVFNKYEINQNYFMSINYNYVVAKIDEEDADNGAYNGKYMPGVSKHNITLNFGTKYDNITGLISHSYRSKAYNSEDFTNSASQKQQVYNSTNLSLKYKLDKQVTLSCKINNLFDKKNGMWVRDDHIYPINFERTFIVGLNAKF